MKVRVYIDETGDRGASESSSPIFGMAAVVVSDRVAPRLRQAVDQLRVDFKVPTAEPMSWKKHVKTHDRRRHAAEVLAGVEGLLVCYVYVRKSDLGSGTYRDDPTRMYNYLAYKMFKSAVWAGRAGGADSIDVLFGHVRRHDHTTTKRYIEKQREVDRLGGRELVSSMQWISADKYRESQAADLFGGFLKAATWPDGEFNLVEPAYLLRIWPVIRTGGTCAIPLGIMPMPTYDVLTCETWFPCRTCPQRRA